MVVGGAAGCAVVGVWAGGTPSPANLAGTSGVTTSVVAGFAAAGRATAESLIAGAAGLKGIAPRGDASRAAAKMKGSTVEVGTGSVFFNPPAVGRKVTGGSATAGPAEFPATAGVSISAAAVIGAPMADAVRLAIVNGEGIVGNRFEPADRGKVAASLGSALGSTTELFPAESEAASVVESSEVAVHAWAGISAFVAGSNDVAFGGAFSGVAFCGARFCGPVFCGANRDANEVVLAAEANWLAAGGLPAGRAGRAAAALAWGSDWKFPATAFGFEGVAGWGAVAAVSVAAAFWAVKAVAGGIGLPVGAGAAPATVVWLAKEASLVAAGVTVFDGTGVG